MGARVRASAVTKSRAEAGSRLRSHTQSPSEGMASVQFEGAPERARAFVDPQLWEALQPFDLANDLHLDRMAEGLLDRFRQQDDGKAFKALLELTSWRLEQIAAEVAAEVGLIMPPADLASTFASRLFITTKRPTAPTKHFLAEAARQMTEEAEAWVRDYALTDVTAADRADGELGKAPNTVSRGYAQIVRACFHRLDKELRQFLRAFDVEQLSVKEIAARYNLTTEQAAKKVHDAKHRLDELVQAAQEGSA